MSDTPIIDALTKYMAPRDRRAAINLLRTATPWTPPAEEIEAMARALCDHKGYARITTSERDEVLVVCRARPIMCELYDNDGAAR